MSFGGGEPLQYDGLFEVLRRLMPGLSFDPYAPEGERRGQLAALRTGLERRAG